MLDHLKRHKSLYGILVIFFITALILYNFPPDKIVKYIGIENSYLATFLIVAIGGLSSVTSGAFYAAVATFSAGGAIPWLLGLVGGVGIAIGDSIIFWLISYGVKDIRTSWKNKVEKIRSYVDRSPNYVVYGGLFIILGLTPIPNDLVLFALVVLGFEYFKILPILLVSGITITTIVAYLGKSLTDFFFG
jgi:hypothetical protein